MTKDRITVRVVAKDCVGRIDQILEQEVPADEHSIELLLRRAPFRSVIAEAALNGGTATIERKGR